MTKHDFRFTPQDHERIKETLDSLSYYPTEEEAEAVLRACGTSGKEVVNEFIERLLRERSALHAAAEAALRCLQGTGDKTIEQVKDQLRAALHPQPEEGR